MQIGSAELQGLSDARAFDAWVRKAKRYFDTERGGCSASAGEDEAFALFFNLPNGADALEGFAAHLRGIDADVDVRLFLMDEAGRLQPQDLSSA